MRENGFGKLVSLIDTDLRNCIAHLKFEIEKDEIYLKVKTKGKVKRRPIFPMLFDNMLNLLVASGYIEGRLSVLAEDRGIVKKENHLNKS